MADRVVAEMAVKIGANIAQFNTNLKSAQGQFKQFTSSITNTAKGLVAGLGLIAIGKQIIEVTAQFQKFEAILTNTLGSNSEAQRALKNIKEFAITTPFEVDEVTAAYVRWANQGLTPTIDRMKKLGDVAASLGAGFEQTAEAFKDLAVGQTKRLEEIGISAEAIKGTNQLRLAFKGVTLEIEKNVEGVQKALDVYSQLDGVLGTSEAVAQTLGGKISNLSDAFTNFFNAFGQSKSGPVVAIINGITDAVNAMANAIDLANFDSMDHAIEKTQKFADGAREAQEAFKAGKGFDQANQMFMDLTKAINETNEDIQDAIILMDAFKSGGETESEQYKKLVTDLGIYNAELQIYKDLRTQITKSVEDYLKKLKEGGKVEKAQLTGLNALRAKEQELIKLFNATDINDKKKLYNLSQQIAATRALIASIEDLQRLSKGEEDISSTKVGDRFLPQLVMKPIDAKEFIKSLDGIQIASNKTFKQIESDIVDLGPMISGAISNFASALGRAAAGTENFGEAMLGAIGSLATQFGSVLISMGVGTIALKSGNPYAMIAGGAVLVAAGAALSAVSKRRENIDKEMGGAGGSGGRTSTGAGFNSVGVAQDSQLVAIASVQIKGSDLWLVFNNYERERKYTHG